MTILGKDDREETFIVKMTRYELAYFQNSSHPGSVNTRVGSEVEIDKAYEHLRAFQSAASSIEAAAKTLRAVADLAETARVNYIINPTENEQPA